MLITCGKQYHDYIISLSGKFGPIKLVEPHHFLLKRNHSSTNTLSGQTGVPGENNQPVTSH